MLYPPNTILLDKYRVQRLLGHGGSAEVYLVTHLALGIDRVLKVISKDLPGVGSSTFGDYRKRFAQEAMLGARLDHPNLVRVQDFIEQADMAVLEMEYAPGGSLTDLIAAARMQGQPVPLERCLAIARDAAAGLVKLHSFDIVHRDLKPSNILLDSDGRAKVSDLGLAQTPGGPSDRSMLGEDAPRHPGTLAYMSPEQRAERDHLAPSADVYAFGSTLFELLTLRQVRNLPTGSSAANLRADVPAWLDDLIAQCLSDAPGDRPWDGAALAGQLDEGTQEAALEAQAKAQAEAETKAAAVRLAQAEKESEVEAARLAKESAEREAREAAEWEESERKLRLESERRAAEAQAATNRAAGELSARRAKEEEARKVREQAARDKSQRPLPLETAANLKSGSDGVGGKPAITKKDTRQTQRWGLVVMGLVGMLVAFLIVPDLIQRLSLPQDGTSLRPDGLPDIAWVDVPEGPFIMGSDDHYDDEKPKRTVPLPIFKISKFETTNAQYHAFVNAADGYSNDQWWNEPVKLALRQTQPGDPIWTAADRPAENVSWYDAVAYTRWLTVKLLAAGELEAGTEIRLPTEEEWEKAARGTDGREYPWGDGYKAGYANLDEKNSSAGPAYLARTAPVGYYPEGASPFGALDMAGNVWEWTLTDYENKRSDDLTSARPGVLRGGSWFDNPDIARVSYRDGRYDPHYRFNNVGFRVVGAAPVP